MKTVEKYNNFMSTTIEYAIQDKIFVIRGKRVMLSMHLAKLYGTETRILMQAVKRNIDRFPQDFMFWLNKQELDWLVSQNVIPHKKFFGGSIPFAFTEQGVAMLSSILKSKQAIQVNIRIMRAFIKLKQIIETNHEFLQKLKELEQKIEHHDEDIIAIFNAIRKLMQEEEKPKRKIGFLRN